MPQHFSEQSFWHKLTKYAKVAGSKVVERALQLFYVAQDSNTPKWAKGVIYTALGYFIFPADAVPDFIPEAGYADDLTMILAALAAVAMFITPEIKNKAKDKMKEWFR